MPMLFYKKTPYFRKKKTFLPGAHSAVVRRHNENIGEAVSHQPNGDSTGEIDALPSSARSSSNISSHLNEHEKEIVIGPNMYSMYK